MPQPDDRVTPPPASLPVAERSAGDVTMPSAAGIASWATTSGRAINSRDRLIALAIGVLYAALLAPLLRYGIDDLRLAAVFSSDESLSGIIVRTMLDGRTLSPNHFFAYGALYHELGALLVVPLAWSGPSDYAILLALRAVSLLAGAGALSLLYLLGARLSGTATGLLAVAIAAASPTLARWSVTAHPDTLQLLLMTGCLIAICAVRHSPSRGRLALAAALAGLAFATKYGGALLLPVVLLADAAGLAATGVG